MLGKPPILSLFHNSFNKIQLSPVKLAQWYSRSCHLKQIIDDKQLTRDKLIGSGVTVSSFPSQFFPRGKNGPAHSFPREKTDWGGIPACNTGLMFIEAEYLTYSIAIYTCSAPNEC